MTISSLNKKPNFDNHVKLKKAYLQFESLLIELQIKMLPERLILAINEYIDALNLISCSENEFLRVLQKTQTNIIKLIEKEIKFVPINYYRNHWLAIGIATFGIPIGLAIAAGLGNMAFFGLGLPIGAALGLKVGSDKDKQAYNEGRQIDVEIKY